MGTYKIEIMAYRANKQQQPPASAPSDFPGADTSPPLEQYIPEKFNAKTELEITVPSGSGEITKDFDLTD